MKLIAKRRRLEHKTNYAKRRRLLEGKKPRVIIRKSNKYITIQYIESSIAQDNVKLTVISSQLIDYGWPKEKIGSLKSLGAAYLTGLLFGFKMKNNKEAILDTGLIRSTTGSRIYAALNGIVDSGFKIAHNNKVFPSKERINSENLNKFFEIVKEKIMKEKK